MSTIKLFIRKLKLLILILPYSWTSIISIVFLWFFLWKTNQGQDMLVSLSSNVDSISILFFVSIFALALFNWFFPKKYFGEFNPYFKKFQNLQLNDEENSQYSQSEINELRKFLPRYFAYLTIIIAGYSISHIGELQMYYGNKDGLFSLYTVFVTGLIPLVFYKKLRTLFFYVLSKSAKTNILVFSLLIGFTLLPLFLYMIGLLNHWVYFICLLFSPFMLAILVYGLLVVRTHISDRSLTSGGIPHRFVNFIKEEDGQFIHWTINTAIIYVLAFIYLNVNPDHAVLLGPGLTFVVSLIAILVILNVLVVKIKRISEVARFFTVIISISVFGFLIFSNNNNKFQVHSLEGKIAERISANEYTKEWFSSYPSNLDSTIYLVASYGGGIRATYWTNLVLSKYMQETNNTFFDQTFGLSGSSGGMVGQGLFMSLYGDPNKRIGQDSIVEELDNFYKKKDYLSPLIPKMLGFDMVKSLLPLGGPDRHRILESLFEDRLCSIDKGEIFQKDFLDYWYNENNREIRKPILICNSTYSQKGIRAFYSPVTFHEANSSHSIDLFDTLQSFDKSHGSIAFSTAVLQSARFPFVSPPGTFPNGMQFVDSGYYDNLGGSGTLDLLRLLADYLKRNPENNFAIKVIIINSAPVNTNQDLKDAYPGFINPLNSYMNTGGGHTKAIENQLRDYCGYLKDIEGMNVSIISNSLRLSTDYKDSKTGKEQKYIYPLGWYLSKKASGGMKNKVKSLDLRREDN